MPKDTILSYSGNHFTLEERERVLKGNGFDVVSVETETQARFEIEMGRCGILLICFQTHPDKTQELAKLFHRNCPSGSILFVMNEEGTRVPEGVDRLIPETGGPQAIVSALRETQKNLAAH